MGKFLHELQWATQTPDNALLAISDPDDPTHLRKITLRDLRTVIKGLPLFDDLPVSGVLGNPTWTVEGVTGGWKITFTSIVTDALYYLIYYYDAESESWIAHHEAVTETRSVATEPLTYTVNAPLGTARVFRKFKVKTMTAEAVSELSSEKSAWSQVQCPADFAPAVPTIETSGYPSVSTNPAYGVFGLSVTLKFYAATGEADYIQRYEIQRQDSLQSGAWPTNPLTWRNLPAHQVVEDDPAVPAKKTIYYVDDSQMARAGFKVRYKVRAVARNGQKSDWTDPVEKLLVDDTTAPDVPVITAIQKQLQIHVSFDPPTESGGPCPDFDYFQLQYSKDGGAYTDVPGDGMVVGTDYMFAVPLADIDSTFSFKARAYDKAATPNVSNWCTPTVAIAAAKIDTNALTPTVQSVLSQVSTNASNISTHTSEISQNAYQITLRATQTDVNTLTGRVSTAESNISVNAGNISLKVSKNSVINEINISTETIAIKGRTVISAETGARVLFYPSSEIGLQVIDDSGNDVLKAMVGGTNVGDVIIGSSSKYVKWDKSDGKVEIKVGGATQYAVFSEDSTGACVLDLYNTGITTSWGAVSLRSGSQSPASAPAVIVFNTKSGSVSKIAALTGGALAITSYDFGASAYETARGYVQAGDGTNALAIDATGDLELDSATGILQALKDINLASGKALKINGTTVLSGQMTAITKPSADVASLKTAVDALIDGLKGINTMAA